MRESVESLNTCIIGVSELHFTEEREGGGGVRWNSVVRPLCKLELDNLQRLKI